MLCLNSGSLVAACRAPPGDSVHWAYYMVCPVCKDTTGCDREGKETQHSFKELDLLGGNNSHGRKTRMKITTGCSGTQEGYSSFIGGCFMFMLGNTEETHSPEVLPFFHHSIYSLIEIP